MRARVAECEACTDNDPCNPHRTRGMLAPKPSLVVETVYTTRGGKANALVRCTGCGGTWWTLLDVVKP